MGCRPRIEGVENTEALATRALELFLSGARSAIAARGVFTVAVSGGHTPEPFFKLLGQSREARALAWDSIHVFWADERYVPADHPDSNYGLADRTFLKAVPIPDSNVHRVPTDQGTPCGAVHSYEDDLQRAFKIRSDEAPAFDLILLGMGPDGHTASLFPYSFAAMDAEHLAGVVSRPEGPCRVTLMPKVLRGARQIVVLVSGKDKARILAEVFTRAPDPLRYPIHVLWPVLDRVLWLADQEALGLWRSRGA
jgi:6-phosphogluconolactonase